MSRIKLTSPHSPSLLVVGINHDTAPLHVREHFALPGERLAEALQQARELAEECVILSTCNRLEIYLLMREQGDPDNILFSLFGEEARVYLPHVYRHAGRAAIRHLFAVASGVNSLILGEVQILGQVRRAWESAHRAGAAGPILSHLFHKAVTLGKRVHSETPLSRQPASVSYAAVVLAKQIFGPTLASRRALVIGTGEVGEGVTRCLHEYKLPVTVVAHRQLERARDLAERYGAEVATWDELPRRLGGADVVISSTSAPHTILQRGMVEDAMRERAADRPLYLIDLAVPRDIDPSAAELPGVHLRNIDDLQAVVQTTMLERQVALPAIKVMIDLETARFTEWLRARAAAPAIQELRARAERITTDELRRASAKLPNLSPRERQVVEAMVARITGKLLHVPVQLLKAQAVEGEEPAYGLDTLSAKELAGLFYSGEDQE